MFMNVTIPTGRPRDCVHIIGQLHAPMISKARGKPKHNASANGPNYFLYHMRVILVCLIFF